MFAMAIVLLCRLQCKFHTHYCHSVLYSYMCIPGGLLTYMQVCMAGLFTLWKPTYPCSYGFLFRFWVLNLQNSAPIYLRWGGPWPSLYQAPSLQCNVYLAPFSAPLYSIFIVRLLGVEWVQVMSPPTIIIMDENHLWMVPGFV